MGFRIVIGADSAGADYRDAVKADLQADSRVSEVVDVGVAGDDATAYPHIALEAAAMIAAGRADRGLLICGTGMGMAIAANKVPGIRASVAHDSFSVERLILSNNAQVLTLGARVIGVELARRLVREWMGYCFDPQSPSQAKIEVLESYERELGAPSGVNATEPPVQGGCA